MQLCPYYSKFRLGMPHILKCKDVEGEIRGTAEDHHIEISHKPDWKSFAGPTTAE